MTYPNRHPNLRAVARGDRTKRGLPVKGGHNGSWTFTETHDRRTIRHYSTIMLEFRIVHEDGQIKWDGDTGDVYLSTGNGSVSDQNGMNSIFKELGMPFYFSRRGGAEIVQLANV